jgi:hypothetical protein
LGNPSHECYDLVFLDSNLEAKFRHFGTATPSESKVGLFTNTGTHVCWGLGLQQQQFQRSIRI